MEAVEALAAAIVALAEEEQTAPTVKIERKPSLSFLAHQIRKKMFTSRQNRRLAPPTPVNTPNAYGQLFAAQNGTASLGQT